MKDKKPYSDKRWWDNPMPVFSLCGKCKYWKGFGKCEKLSTVPDEILDKSFPGTERFDENYCQYREEN